MRVVDTVEKNKSESESNQESRKKVNELAFAASCWRHLANNI